MAAEGLRGRSCGLTVLTEGIPLVLPLAACPRMGRLGDLGSPGGNLSPSGVLGCTPDPQATLQRKQLEPASLTACATT